MANAGLGLVGGMFAGLGERFFEGLINTSGELGLGYVAADPALRVEDFSGKFAGLVADFFADLYKLFFGNRKKDDCH